MSGRLWRLQVPDQPIRGAYVSLGADWPALVAQRGYGAAAASLLGQTLAALPLLLVHLKTEAKLSLQISQSGPLTLLAAQGGTEGAVRGLIKLQGEDLDPASLTGNLLVSLEPSGATQHYQGIVALEGDGPDRWLERYFAQSEQVETRFILRADQDQAAGFMLQAMPGQQAGINWTAAMDALDLDFLPEQPGEWLSTMLACDLRMSEEPQNIHISCNCNINTVSGILLQLGRDDLAALLAEQGQVSVECGFCGHNYRFDADQVNALIDASGPPDAVH